MEMTFDTAAFDAALQQATQRLTATLGQAAVAGAEVLTKEIVINVVAMDIVDTGHYRDSWEPVPGEASATEASADAQSEVDYGPVLEYGSSDSAGASPAVDANGNAQAAKAKRHVVARPAVRTAFDSPDVHEKILEAEAAAIERVMGK